MVETQATVKRAKRSRFSIEFKAHLAVRACEPGVSVSQLALDHGLNTNMLFRWRRQYQTGELMAPVQADPALVPVNVVAHTETPLVQMPNPATRFHGSLASKPAAGVIEIRIGGAVVHLEGEVDVIRLRAVLSALRA